MIVTDGLRRIHQLGVIIFMAVGVMVMHGSEQCNDAISVLSSALIFLSHQRPNDAQAIEYSLALYQKEDR